MMSWLRRRFVTGFFVLVPVVVSIVALHLGIPCRGWLYGAAVRAVLQDYHASDVPPGLES